MQLVLPCLILVVAQATGPTARPDEAVEAAAETELPTLDIEAYFEGSPFHAAQRLVAAGRTQEAIRALKRLLREHPDAEVRPQARYLLGLSLIRAGEYEQAARLFEELALSYPLLEDDHRFFRGQALYLWGSYADAAAVLTQVDPDGPRGDEAKRLRAWALLESTDFSRLARWLQSELDRDGRLEPELLYLLGRARHRTGDILGAYRAFREVWREAPSGELAGPALAHLAKLEIGDKPMLSAAERNAIEANGRALLSGRDFDDVMARLERQLSRSEDGRRLSAEIAYARGRSAEARRRFVGAAEHYARALAIAPAEMMELRATVALARGRAIESTGQEARALEAYELVSSRFPDRPEAEDALFYAGEILLRTRKYDEARAKCEALLLANPVTEHRRACLWNVGWSHYRQGQYDSAHQFFGSLANMSLPAELDGASRYWLARTEATLGRITEARHMFESIVERYPLSYYAALSEGQLAEALEEGRLGDAGTDAASASPSDLPKEIVQAREYVRLGLRSRALEALSGLEKSKKARGRRFDEPAYHALARLYDELGRNAEARRVREEGAREFPTSLGSEAFIRVARRAHPLKFEEQIRAAAEEHGLPESLLFALIRTESGFRQDAVSAMNAYGLAQLILPTARQVAARLRAGRVTERRLLYDPALNVRLGAAYLRELLDRYDGSEPLALAAYNAGPSAVDAWVSRRVRGLEGVSGRGIGMQPAADELGEEIPVAETRAFVKVVLARARGYARLYARPPEVVAPLPPMVALAAYAEPEHLPAPPELVPAMAPGSRVLRGMVRAPSLLGELYAPPPNP